MEECGVISSSLRQIGVLVFEFIGEAQLMEVHVYSTDDFTGTVAESEGTLHQYCCPWPCGVLEDKF